MVKKTYLAYHKEYPKPSSDSFGIFDVNNCLLDNDYYSELSMIYSLIQQPQALPDEVGVAHYRRFMQSDSFMMKSESIPPFVFSREYGKDSRPTLPYSDEYYNMVTDDYNIELGDKDILVLEPFIKSGKKSLYSLCHIGWLEQEFVNNFFIFLKRKLNKYEYEHIYELNNNNNIHYCNNIMYSGKKVFKQYWKFIFDILIEFETFMLKTPKRKLQISPRCYGYLAEYLMRPVIEIQGYNVGYRKSICFE